MERGEPLGLARATTNKRVILHPLTLALLIFASTPQNAHAATQTLAATDKCGVDSNLANKILSRAAPRAAGNRIQRIKQLYSTGQWEKVICLTLPRPGDPPDIDYYRGMALAKLKRWRQAGKAFERGRQKAPRDERFPTELAGIAFQEKRYGAAKKNLGQALRLDPRNAYANNFLATIFSLEGNLPAALKYWNRAGMPKIQSIRMRPQPQVDPVLLSNAITFSPGGILDTPDFRTTETNLDSLGIFSGLRLELDPLANGQFDANFISNEKNGLGGTKIEDILSILRGVPYETLYPEWFNIRRRAINFTSLLRWDPNKERIFLSLAGPLGENPHRRYRFYFDGRRENWNLTNTFFATSMPVNNMRLEKLDGGGEIEFIPNGRLRWNAGLDLSGRSFSNIRWNNPSAAGFFKNGFALEYYSGLDARLLDIPERRLSLNAGASGQLGKQSTPGSSPFAQIEGRLLARWFPRAQGNDYEMTAEFRGGKTWGTVPFDDLFILGIERDNSLWLRAHVGTADGKKGSAPFGRNYLLLNWDDFKSVYRNGFFSFQLGPFFDAGKISDPTAAFGSRQWLLDTGIELKVHVLGSATIELFFGKDLRTGRNAFYGTTSWPGMMAPGFSATR